MAKGTVVWFSNSKNFGFIDPSDGGADIFVHFSAIQMDGYKTLEKGEHVEFDVDYRIEDNKPIAVNVRKLEDSHGTASNSVHGK
jgi:CspA family cold shock protein